jgi:Tol biopolymer transport system component
MYSTSDNEILTYREPFVSHSRFTWFDRDGDQVDVLPLPEGAQSPELSPDETRLAFERTDPETGWRDVWIWEFERRVATKLTTHPANDSDPVWSPDGRSIIFSSSRHGYPSLHRMEVGSSAAPELIHEAQGEDWPSSWSADGRHVIFMRWSPGAREGKLLLLALSDGGEPRPFLHTDAQEISAQFSPDGKWVAYVTNKTGRDEVFVVPFPPTGEVRQASTEGGSDPRWRGDGRELYYLDPERKLMAVAVSSTGTAPQLSRLQ